MCVIVYKPKEVAFPEEALLKNCWEVNSDGAGYMFAYKNKVHIKKGYMAWNDLKTALDEDKEKYGTDIPYVIHFRITTQGGVKQELCHPYCLSRDMDDLRQLNHTAKMGIAHNGIISLTSDSALKYNDTMKFITDYLALIIHNKNYYKNKDNLSLISKLAGSKLAIMDYTGHVELIGEFNEKDGCYYSNYSYVSYSGLSYLYGDDYKYEQSSWNRKYMSKTNNHKTDYKKLKGKYGYNFIPEQYCPKYSHDDCSYCGACIFRDFCKKENK